MISEFPLFMFTTLGGLAAGAYATSAVFPPSKSPRKEWLLPLACLALLAMGAVFLPLHLGRPERMLQALTQPGAMIAQEAYWGAAFGILVLVDVVASKVKGSSPRALRIVGAIAGLGLVVVMANAYYVSIGVAAWASWQTFALYVVGDLAMGAALLAVFDRSLVGSGPYMITAIVLAALSVLSIVFEVVHFAGVGADFVLLAVGAAVVLVGAIVACLAKAGKIDARIGATAMLACLFIGVALARYGFYAAYGA